MKTILPEQIRIILDELMSLNIPVKSFIGIQELLAKLPLAEESKTK